MHDAPEITIALLLCFALTLGAAISVASRRIRLPYSVAMLLAGLVSGLAILELHRRGLLPRSLERLAVGRPVSPELIVFIFLPVLIFESSFATQVHAFRKNLGALLLLAGPAVLLSAFATAGMLVVLTAPSWHWGWLPALLFGALISATDPVAVVALLREAGAPKRICVLIEGESLLNDGTAIVLFGVLLELVTGGHDFATGPAVLRFLWVSLGGLGVGLLLAMATTSWLSRIFNAPLIEITITLALAYGAMFVGEHLLHVSGVLAVVAAGLWMSGRGRLHISPEVAQFLHRFWEMLSYLANTLIFFLVGLVIATPLTQASDLDLPLIVAIYAGIVALRFLMILLFRPLVGRVSPEISSAEARVMAWGGLRGAVSLALALVLASDPRIDPRFASQILLTTAGVVLLTILINGSTTGWLLRRLGFDRSPAGDRLASHSAEVSSLALVERRIDGLASSRELRAVDWSLVREDLVGRASALARRVEQARRELAGLASGDRISGQWRQALNMERQAIWGAFADGTLGAEAARILAEEIDQQLDRMNHGADAPSEEREPRLPFFRSFTALWLRRLGLRLEREQFELLALRYDLLRGQQLAAELVLRDLAEREGVDTDVRESLRDAYRRHLHRSKERLEDLRVHLPEITQAIETRLARRIQLNLERESYQQLARSGALDPSRAAEALADVELRMKRLHGADRRVPLPETGDLCRSAPLFAELDEAAIALVARLTKERVFAPDELLFREGDEGRSMYIIARGAVAVVQRRPGAAADGPCAAGEGAVLLDILGGGEILGEMALLTGAPRVATARAVTSVIAGEISRSDFQRLLAEQPRLEDGIWQSFAERCFDNHVRHGRGFEQLGHDERIAWFRRGRVLSLMDGEALPGRNGELVFVVTGSLASAGERWPAPALRALQHGVALHSAGPSRVALLPALFAA